MSAIMNLVLPNLQTTLESDGVVLFSLHWFFSSFHNLSNLSEFIFASSPELINKLIKVFYYWFKMCEYSLTKVFL